MTNLPPSSGLPAFDSNDYPAGSLPGETVPRPASVENSFRAWLVAAVIGIIGSLLGTIGLGANKDAEIDKLIDASPTLSRSAAESAYTIGLVLGVVVTVVIAALAIFFAFQFRQGKNWARIVLTVLAALGIILSLLSLVSFSVVSVLDLIVVVIYVVALYFAWQKTSTAFFNSARARQ